MASNPEDYVSASERIIASVTEPDVTVPADRNLAPGDHADALKLAQVNATLAGVSALLDIACTLDQIRLYGIAQDK